MKVKKNIIGKLIWIEGLSGSGKTTLANKIHPFIVKKFGPTIIFNGDDLRSAFDLKSYSAVGRKKIFNKYIKLSEIILKQKINIIFTVVGLKKFQTKILNNKFPNIIKILIKADINKLISKSKKKTYKLKKNIVGLDIKAEWPKNPDILIINNFDKSLKNLTNELIKKLNCLIKKKI